MIDADGNVAKELRRREAGHARRRRARGAVLLSALPPQLADGIERLVARAGGSVAKEVEPLSAAYRGEQPSRAARTPAQVAAYLAYRAPATFAAAAAVFRQVALQRPEWRPRSLLDAGAGPGVAAWAAVEQWPSLSELTLVEIEPAMIAAGRELLPDATWIEGDVAGARGPAELVVVSYVLGELARSARRAALGADRRHDRRSSSRARRPATGACSTPAPRCSRRAATRSRRARTTSRARCRRTTGATSPSGCRARSCTAHAKGVELGYEDEKFSYAALSREPVPPAAARIIRQPQPRSGHVHLVTCEPDGIHERTVSRKQGALYKEARGASWGDALNADERT